MRVTTHCHLNESKTRSNAGSLRFFTFISSASAGLRDIHPGADGTVVPAVGMQNSNALSMYQDKYSPQFCESFATNQSSGRLTIPSG